MQFQSRDSTHTNSMTRHITLVILFYLCLYLVLYAFTLVVLSLAMWLFWVSKFFGNFDMRNIHHTIISLGRKPVFIMSIFVTMIGRIGCILTSGVYWLFAAASVFGMLTALTMFQSPLVIAMEICKGEDRAHIAMLQCWGWTVSNYLIKFLL